MRISTRHGFNDNIFVWLFCRSTVSRRNVGLIRILYKLLAEASIEFSLLHSYPLTQYEEDREKEV